MIRPYEETDREALLDIVVRCFDERSSIARRIDDATEGRAARDWTWRKRREIERDIANNANGVFVAEEEGRPVGFITTREDQDTRIGLIANLAVLRDHRDKGLGRSLIDASLAYLRKQGMTQVKIETLESNPVGQHLYVSCGFKEVARQIHYVMNIDPDTSDG